MTPQDSMVAVPDDQRRMQDEIAAEWQQYWQTHTDIPAWDYMSEIVGEAVRAESGPLAGRRVLEAGCGTGRISLDFAHRGAAVTCIDLSPEAVAMTQAAFAAARLPVDARVASLFSLPFGNGEFDVVWNAGVLEHFSEQERHEALAELIRVVKGGGLVITLNPYRYAVAYRVGKFVSEKLGRWPYGHEDPIATLAVAAQGLPVAPSREYSTGFFVVLVEALRVSNVFLPVLRALRALLIAAHRGSAGPLVRAIDRTFSRLLGGYLLVSTFRKR